MVRVPFRSQCARGIVKNGRQLFFLLLTAFGGTPVGPVSRGSSAGELPFGPLERPLNLPVLDRAPQAPPGPHFFNVSWIVGQTFSGLQSKDTTVVLIVHLEYCG